MKTKEKDNYLKETLEAYINRTFAKTPVPGGGSVVACVSSLSSALIGMVLNYTLGKERYIVYEKELKDIFVENEIILKKLSAYIERDSEIYANIRKYTSSKDAITATKYLKESAALHLDICRAALKIIEFAEILAEKGNQALISDTGISSALAVSVFISAKINLLINLKYITGDKEFITNSLQEIERMEKEVIEKGKAVTCKVLKKLEIKDG